MNEIPAIVSFIASIIGLASIFIGIKWFNLSVASIALGAMLRSIVNLIGLFLFTLKIWKEKVRGKLSLDFIVVRKIAKEAVPLFASNLLGIVLNNSKELMLAILISPASAAILSITNRIFTLVAMIINPIFSSTFAALASISADLNNFIKWSIEFTKSYNFLTGLLYSITLSINAYFVSVWVGADKFGGILLSVFLGTSNWLTTRCNFTIIMLNAKGIFNITSLISMIDFIIRFLFISIILKIGIQFQVYYLPLIETFTILLSVVFLEFSFTKKIFGKSKIFNKSINQFLFNIIFWTFVGITFHLTIQFAPQETFSLHSWINLIITSFVVACIILFLLLMKKQNQQLVKKFVLFISPKFSSR